MGNGTMPNLNVLVANLAQATVGLSFVIPIVDNCFTFYSMPSAGRLVLTPKDAVHNSAPTTPKKVAAASRGRTRERPDVATDSRARSTRTPTPTFSATTKRIKVPEPTKSPEVLNTEIAADLNAKAQEFVEQNLVTSRNIHNTKIWSALALQSLSTNAEST